MSGFTEQVFKKYSEKRKAPLLLTKSGFSRLVQFCDINLIPSEVNEKLDMLVKYLTLD